MKPRDEWGPADEMAYAIAGVFYMLVVGFFIYTAFTVVFNFFYGCSNLWVC